MGLEVNLKRVKRLMKENRIFSIITKQYKYYKKGNESVSLVRNVLNRDFSTETINEKWVSDITYIWSRKEGWCYLSSIMDLYSNRIISHKVGKFMDIKLVMETLKEAYYVRGRKSNIIIHTDRGSQYMSKEYRDYCKSSKMIVSYSRKGNPYDNACIESFHATLKKEYIHHKKFDTIEEIKVGIFEYIEKWYNRERIQEKIGYLTPVEFEEMSKKII
ncbi:MAG: IS3 family transposase [Leptotrichiaceae bacterium]|jgi:putative transposase|nr:IS3 family transposase [Leptotrichiaceae bacterium]